MGLYVRRGLGAVAIEVELPNLAVVHVVSWELYIVVVYRPPSYSADEIGELLQFLTDFCVDREVLVMGDFIFRL